MLCDLFGDLELPGLNKVHSIDIWVALSERGLVACVSALLEEVDHALEFLLGEGRENTEVFEKVYFFVDLPLEGVTDDNLIILFVNHSKRGVHSAHRSSIPRLISHESQLAKCLASLQIRDLLRVWYPHLRIFPRCQQLVDIYRYVQFLLIDPLNHDLSDGLCLLLVFLDAHNLAQLVFHVISDVVEQFV